jgi:hypothetical protein
MKILFACVVAIAITLNVFGQKTYRNDMYGFSGVVPDDWKIYAEIKNDPSELKAIIDWGLPQVYSELEKASIENAVSITAYKKAADIKNLNDLIKFEFQRIAYTLVTKEVLKGSTYTSYVVITLRDGLIYKTNVSFVFKNNIGYVIAFTATPGTYDKNLAKFEAFVKGIVFAAPVSK